MMRTERKEWFSIAKKAIENERIVILQGLRRIGKTRVLDTLALDLTNQYQLIKYEFNIFGQDDQENMLNFLNVFTSNPDTRYLLLLDEFQDFTDWNKFFKTIYDKYPMVKIFATGSVSHNTTATSNTEGGRYKIITMPTLSFNEYKSIFNKLPIPAKEMEYFWEYATLGSYPSQSWTMSLSTYKSQVTKNIIEKIKDASLLEKASISKSVNIDSILRYLIANTGANLAPTTISRQLKISKEIVSKIIEYLKDNHIIYQINNTINTKGRSAALNNKYYLNDHTFYLFDNTIEFKEMYKEHLNESSFIFENIVCNELRRRNTRYQSLIYFIKDTRKNHEVDLDFVVEKEGKKYYFEVKLTDKVSCLSTNQKRFIEKIKNKLNIIYLGKDILSNNKNYINIITFLKGGETWI